MKWEKPKSLLKSWNWHLEEWVETVSFPPKMTGEIVHWKSPWAGESLKGHTIAEGSLSQVGNRWWSELKALSSSPPPLFIVHMVSVKPSTVSLSWFPTYKMQSSITLPVLPILRTSKKTVRSWLSLLWAFMHVFSFQCPLAPNPR